MKTATFHCPHCSSPLRIRDRAFVDREIGCPECGKLLEVTLDRDKEPVAQKVTAESGPMPPRRRMKSPVRKSSKNGASKKRTTPADTSNPAQSVPLSRKPLFTLGEKFSSVPEVLFSPVGIAWLVAGFVALILLILAWPSGETVQPVLAEQTVAESEPSRDQKPPQESTALPTLPSPAADVEDEAIFERMSELGRTVDEYLQARGHFPAGTVDIGNQPVHDRFSWQADLLVATDAKTLAPQWDRAWNDVLNDRFVRQQREAFLNPALSVQVGERRYPATHFVGVAGVGNDAPLLPLHHPRAGIFGIDRRTRPDDIKDGLANTMMIAGVADDLGSWAAGGKPTMRAFTQEPYIGGPDGFGTGEAGGMSALMADGSVRFLSENTDPAVVRQLAAMSDEFYSRENDRNDRGPLAKIDHSKPNPQMVEQPLSPKIVVAENQELEPEPDPMPAEAEPGPKETVDIPQALAVKITRFEQIQSAPLGELLFQVEELTGVPMRRDADLPAAEDDFWSQPVSLKMNDATVQEILEALLQKADLDYQIESDHIRLHKAD